MLFSRAAILLTPGRVQLDSESVNSGNSVDILSVYTSSFMLASVIASYILSWKKSLLNCGMAVFSYSGSLTFTFRL